MYVGNKIFEIEEKVMILILVIIKTIKNEFSNKIGINLIKM